MKTCTCCGQQIASSPRNRTTVKVDDRLLALCNGAWREAEARGHAAVEIAHVVFSISRESIPEIEFERVGFARADLSLAAERCLARLPCGSAGDGLSTSDDLKTLLSLAEQWAEAEGRGFASPADLLRVLAEESEALRTARFVVDMRRGAWWRREADRSRVDVQPSVREVDRAVRLVPGERGREEESRDVEGLCARLDRQERLVGDLAGLVSRLMERLDARDAAGPSQRKQEAGRAGAASGRATASGRKGGGGGGSRQGSRWRRHRTVLVGSAACAARGAKDGNRLSEGVLRVVSRSEPVASVARLRPAREGVVDSGGEFEELAAMSADNDLDEDADGQGDRMKRFYLSPDDDLVRAPSIGAKTAARLRPVGLVLVRDLLSCDPADIALRVSTRYITAGRISDWKAQARLVCTIPWLRGTHAQLLVGAGYDTLAKLSRADASAVCAAILRFSATREGQSILRSGPPPEIDRIACWIENTALAEPARAA